MYDWKARLAGRPLAPGLGGYAEGKRITVRSRFRESIIKEPWQPLAPLPESERPAPRQRAARPAAAAPAAPSAGGWRERINRGLSRATGYELKRAPGRK
jgi:hypothetical protein